MMKMNMINLAFCCISKRKEKERKHANMQFNNEEFMVVNM